MSVMSLSKTSHPGGPGPDELGPSRYSLRVGEIDVLVVSDGVLTALPAATLAVNAGPAILAAWLDDMVLPPAFDWPVNVVVVRSGGRTVLIDAGLGVEYKDFRRAGRLLMRLEAAGIDPASLTDVVLTHLHMDHIGGLLGDGVKGRLRPDLRLHVSATEAEFWAGGGRFVPHLHAAGDSGGASVDRHAVLGRVPQPVAAVRDGVRGGAGG